MLRRLSLAAAAVACALVAVPLVSRGAEPVEPPIGVVDLHVDLPWQVHYKHRDMALTEGHASAANLKAGHYIGIVLPIYLPDKAHKDGAHIEDAEAIFDTINKVIEKNRIFLPLLSRLAEPDRISTFLAIEGAGAFAADVKAIDRFIDRGLRLVSPCHENHTALASSATGKKKVDYGLTDLGKEFANRVYDKGALIDVSHVSDKTFDDVVPIAKAHHAPIVATHSNARAIAKVPRNLTDKELQAIAESDGVAGVNLYSTFVVGSDGATIDDLIAQIDHMVKVAGIDHVALGSDYDGGIQPVVGMDDASTFPKLAEALIKHGMKHEDVAKIFSLNALRVLGWRPPPTFAQ